jgi:hypothetical protein
MKLKGVAALLSSPSARRGSSVSAGRAEGECSHRGADIDYAMRLGSRRKGKSGSFLRRALLFSLSPSAVNLLEEADREWIRRPLEWLMDRTTGVASPPLRSAIAGLRTGCLPAIALCVWKVWSE